jgi:sulfhydrogenase subunit beta (sulfur reductase)
MKRIVSRQAWGGILEALKDRGHLLLGPVLRDDAILIDEITGPNDLPTGYTDHQAPGSYRLQRSPDSTVFRFHTGQDSWKRFLLPPQCTLWTAHQTPAGYEVLPDGHTLQPMAFIGMRACDLAAMARLDRVLGLAPDRPERDFSAESRSARFTDPTYAARRRSAFIVAVQCIRPGENCFCSSMGAGPTVQPGFDLLLTELTNAGDTPFLAEAGSLAGEEILRSVLCSEARPETLHNAEKRVRECADRMHKTLDTSDLKAMLTRNWDHPRWQQTADRCLTCGNCTMVCPTCFCTNILDETDLPGRTARRIRAWDSCFSLDYSYVHGGGSVRTSVASRYRHWMIHKLATWIDQFGELGCVGCGRCITWCPAGIDLTEEAAAIRRSDTVAAVTSEEKCYVRS